MALLGTLFVGVGVAGAWNVSITANTQLTRSWQWQISKSVDQSSVTLSPGGTATVNYTVNVSTSGSTDSGWNVSGALSAEPDGNPLLVVGAFGLITPPGFSTAPGFPSGGSLDLSGGCSPALPFLLVSTLVCPYSQALPDGTARSITGDVVLSDGSGNTATAPIDFSNPTITPVDNCVSVSDTYAGLLGTVCASDPMPKTFTYSRTIGPYPTSACGSQFNINNTASFVTNTTGSTGSASQTVNVVVQCNTPQVCPRTIGYWKTHAGFGPQADVVTPLLPIWLGTSGGAKSIKVTTAALAVQLLSMNGSNNVFDASNGINKLYAQLLGAKLSLKSGSSSTSGEAAALAAADAFLATHNSLSWSSLSASQQASVLDWMTTLNDYNNGQFFSGCSG